MPIAAKFMIFLLPALSNLNCATPTASQFSTAPKIELAQTVVVGNLCQTQFGVCPLLDPNLVAIWLPVGSVCFCGVDPGQVRQ